MNNAGPSQASHSRGSILPDNAFDPEELKEVKALITIRDEAYKASKLAALRIKEIETRVRIRHLEAQP